MYWHSTATVPRLYRDSSDTLTWQYKDSTKTVLRQYQDSIETVLRQYQDSIETVPRQYRDNTETALQQFQYSIKTLPRQYRDSTATVPRQYHFSGPLQWPLSRHGLSAECAKSNVVCMKGKYYGQYHQIIKCQQLFFFYFLSSLSICKGRHPKKNYSNHGATSILDGLRLKTQKTR